MIARSQEPGVLLVPGESASQWYSGRVVATSYAAGRYLTRATGKTRDFPLWAQYAVSLGAVAAALLARDLLSPWLGDQFPFATVFLTLFPLVLLVRPGPFLAAALFGWLGVLVLFMRPQLATRWDRTAVLQVGFFMFGVLVATLTSWLSQRSLEREREKDAILRAFVDESPTSKWVTDADGRVVYANKAMAAALGVSLPSILGRPHGDALPEDLRRAADENLRAVCDHGQPQVSLEEMRSTDDGHAARVFEWRRFPLSFDEHGKVALVAAMANDVTDKRRHEQTLRESEARLVATLEERELLLEREREARREAEAATRVKDEFLATLSHELRTPLNAILGWIQLIERNPGESKLVDEAIPVIGRNARAQMSLIADLLDTSRIISGKIHLQLEPLDLADVVRGAVDAVRSAAESKGVRIETDVSALTHPAHGDPDRLQQVLWNLLSNAVKFTSEGSVVHVDVAQIDSRAQIIVRDTGQGISPEFLPYVFERFRQADSSMARRFVGLGLGLSIVKHLVELHGGSVFAHSDGEGTGATFTVELPLAIGPIVDLAPTDARDAAKPARKAETDLRGVKVLAVEDQSDSLDLLRRVLQECHAQVFTARTVDEALATLRRERPDIVLCDLGLPGKDGFEFIRELRESGDRTPAVALTAFARHEDRMRVLRAGYHTHIAKPFDADGLVSIVAVVVGDRRETVPETDGSKP